MRDTWRAGLMSLPGHPPPPPPPPLPGSCLMTTSILITSLSQAVGPTPTTALLSFSLPPFFFSKEKLSTRHSSRTPFWLPGRNLTLSSVRLPPVLPLLACVAPLRTRQVIALQRELRGSGGKKKFDASSIGWFPPHALMSRQKSAAPAPRSTHIDYFAG